jgi:predicted nucleic acid-binding protein
VTLVDAGPLVALIDRDEADHARCVAALASLSLPLVTTWAAFTEAMYLLGDAAGWRGQTALWRLVQRSDLQLAELDDAGMARTRALIEQYRDLPMDLADATLVTVAEQRGLRRLFTLDSDFRVYRLHGRHMLELVPAESR